MRHIYLHLAHSPLAHLYFRMNDGVGPLSDIVMDMRLLLKVWKLWDEEEHLLVSGRNI